MVCYDNSFTVVGRNLPVFVKKVIIYNTEFLYSDNNNTLLVLSLLERGCSYKIIKSFILYLVFLIIIKFLFIEYLNENTPYLVLYVSVW